jgi:predicted CXXCH cytochrome family protein
LLGSKRDVERPESFRSAMKHFKLPSKPSPCWGFVRSVAVFCAPWSARGALRAGLLVGVALAGVRAFAADEAAAQKKSSEKPAADAPAQDKPSTDKPSTGQPSSEKPSPDKAAVTKPAPGRAGVAPLARRGKPTQEDKTRRDFSNDCLGSGCHAALAASAWVHGPVAVGACDPCHVAAKEAGHKFSQPRPPKELCTFCHKVVATEKHVHKAFVEGDCVNCHSPHSGATSALLRDATEERLCSGCHDAHRPAASAGSPAAPSYAFLHKPVSEGRCLGCHRAHQSPQPALLTAPERDLCLSCHPKLHDSLRAASFVHDPVGKECRSCHTAHGGADHRLLVKAANEVCTGCHPKVTAPAPAGAHPHGALGAEGSCVACHDPHAAATKNLAVAPLSEGCFTCHEKEIPLPAGGKVAAISRGVVGAPFAHGPVKEGKCEACHVSHSSSHDALLTRELDVQTYVTFTEKSYELCFGCHDKRLATEPTSTRTKFRDGERNLHFVHVNRTKGRSCALCHETHAGTGPGLLRENVAFGPGGWQLPIGFRAGEAGGSCGPGCHQALEYRRTGTDTPPDRTEANPRPGEK